MAFPRCHALAEPADDRREAQVTTGEIAQPDPLALARARRSRGVVFDETQITVDKDNANTPDAYLWRMMVTVTQVKARGTHSSKGLVICMLNN
ncbi:hypothetical protein MTO96_017899 [Rhipicephalus appendiculatus]